MGSVVMLNHVYTVTYTDSTSGVVCASAQISASTCANNVCEHTLDDVSSLNCFSLSAPIDVTVFATNRLGNGQPSILFTIRGFLIIIM